MPRGRFITFEGGEGAGKSTQSAAWPSGCAGRGIDVPAHARARRHGRCGGDPRADRPWPGRALAAAEPSSACSLAARDDHLHRAILPALDRGDWVLCDRFADSTRVYQGYAGGLGLELVDRLQAPVLAVTCPI